MTETTNKELTLRAINLAKRDILIAIGDNIHDEIEDAIRKLDEEYESELMGEDKNDNT